MASYKSRGQGRGRMASGTSRQKAAAARKRRQASAPRKTRGQGRGYMADPASVRKGRTMKKAGKAAATAAKKRPTTPKKDTRTRGGQGGARGAVDQMAFQRFVNMTPAQQRHVMRMASGETRRKAR